MLKNLIHYYQKYKVNWLAGLLGFVLGAMSMILWGMWLNYYDPVPETPGKIPAAVNVNV